MTKSMRSLIDDAGGVYVIAEIGVNHEGDLDRAISLVELAARGGANCAKFQTYTADELAVKESPAYWDTTKESTSSQHELFSKFRPFNQIEYETIAAHCRDLGLDFASTPFSARALGMLATMIPFVKIASADITNIPLLRAAAETALPILLSTGASDMWEITLALSELKKAGARDVSIMHCVLNYPTRPENANLAMISSLRASFPELIVGYSDHTEAVSNLPALEVAYELGAEIIEKHFTDNPSQPGNDHYHAMTFEQLMKFRQTIEIKRTLKGAATHKHSIPGESIARTNARRSIVSTRRLLPGEVITAEMLTCKRPGSGISPIHWDEVIGMTVVSEIEIDSPMKWHMIGTPQV
jgi:sialic acid synthase SpsE